MRFVGALAGKPFAMMSVWRRHAAAASQNALHGLAAGRGDAALAEEGVDFAAPPAIGIADVEDLLFEIRGCLAGKRVRPA